ncbi:hypothetical protein, partial [Pseudidiomarina sp.]|uniref:hypothetical protein n=1 Tax=Pseudidiomarina sp. TaxID=2081707 RepID=UPI003A983A1B
MAAPIITPIPTPPIRSDAPADFAVKADNFAAALPQFVTETNGSAAFINQRAIDADASAQAAANSEAAVEADRAEVAANAATVAGNAATVVARADEVAANTLQVAADTQQVATDAQSVADALASIAGGPVYSVNGLTGDVTGIATQDGAETLTNKTVVDPMVTLGGSQGVAGQVPVSQGAGLPPSWGSSGAWVLLSTVTASSSATVDVENTFDSAYDAYVIVANDVLPSNDQARLRVLLKIGGTYQTSGYVCLIGYPNTSTANSFSSEVATVASPAAQITLSGPAGQTN